MNANLLPKVRKKTDTLDSKISKTKNGRFIMQSKCAVCSTKKSIFVKEQKSEELGSLGLKTPLSKVPLLDDILF